MANTTQQCGCGTSNVQTDHRRTLKVQFLELDMTKSGATSCNTCLSVEDQVKQVISDLEPVLGQVDTVIELEKILVENVEQAKAYRFKASPSIRVANIEILPSQGDIFGFGERQWEWKGEVYENPPNALIVDAILRAYVSDEEELQESGVYQIPEDLEKFFVKAVADESTGSCGCS